MKNSKLLLKCELMSQSPQTEKTVGIIEDPVSKKLISSLENNGIRVVAYPPVEAVKANFTDGEIEVIRSFDRFDWLVFTDVFAVDFFIAELKESQRDLFELDALRICSVGEAVADRLRFEQLHSDVIPAENQPESVFAALRDYIFEEDFRNLRFLLVKAGKDKSPLVKLLQENQAFVKEIVVCEISRPVSDAPKLKALLKGGGIDEFIFKSPEDVFSIADLFAKEDLTAVFSGVKITAKSEITLQTLREFNLK